MHYSHIRVAAKRAAIAALEIRTPGNPDKIPHKQLTIWIRTGEKMAEEADFVEESIERVIVSNRRPSIWPRAAKIESARTLRREVL